MEMGLVPFTPSKQYDISFLEDICYNPKKNTITWRIEKTLKIGDQSPVTTVTEITVVENGEDNPKQIASMGIASAFANAHNVDRLIDIIAQ